MELFYLKDHPHKMRVGLLEFPSDYRLGGLPNGGKADLGGIVSLAAVCVWKFSSRFVVMGDSKTVPPSATRWLAPAWGESTFSG